MTFENDLNIVATFFTKTKASIDIEEDSEPIVRNEREVFYTEHVSNNQKCTKQKCIEKQNELAKTLKAIKEKRNQVISALNIGEKILKNKSDKIVFLKSQISKLSGRSNDSELIYIKFKESFPSDVLAILRSIDGRILSDSTFVLTCVRSLYKDELDRLKNISVTGRVRKNERKEKMSPQKLKVLRNIFDERLNAVVSKSSERVQRTKKVNEHIKSNFQRKFKTE